MILWPLQHSHSLYTFVRPLQHSHTAYNGTLTTSCIFMASVDSHFWAFATLSRPLYDMLICPSSVQALSCIHTNPKASNGIPMASTCTLMANTSPLLMPLGAHLRLLESLSLPLSALSRPTKLKYFRFGAIKSLHRFKIMVLRRHSRFIASKLSFKWRQNRFIASKRRVLKRHNRFIASKKGFSSNTIASLLQKEGF